MQNSHPVQVKFYEDLKKNKQNLKRKHGESSEVAVPTKKLCLQDQDIKSAFTRPNVNTARQDIFEDKVLAFVASSMQPLSIVENEQFRDLLNCE